MTTGFVLFSVRIPYQFFNSLCCGVGNTPKIQYVLKFVLSLFLCVGCIYKKNIHRRSPTKYLAGVRVDSCCFYTAHIFLAMCSTTTTSRNKLLRLIITRDKTHVQGRIFFCREKRCVDWHVYNWHIAKGESTPNQKIRENPSRLVWMMSLSWSMDSWMTLGYHSWYTSSKIMTARVKCFPMFSLNFPIFLWLHHQSNVCTC